MRQFRFDSKFGKHIPDSVHIICVDCASIRGAMLRPRNYPMKALCDLCEKRKLESYNISDFDWPDYTVE